MNPLEISASVPEKWRRKARVHGVRRDAPAIGWDWLAWRPTFGFAPYEFEVYRASSWREACTWLRDAHRMAANAQIERTSTPMPEWRGDGWPTEIR